MFKFLQLREITQNLQQKQRQLYEHITITKTFYSVDTPSFIPRKFSICGKYLIAFSQQSHAFQVYSYHGPFVYDSTSENVFHKLFSLKYEFILTAGDEFLIQDFCIFNQSFVILASTIHASNPNIHSSKYPHALNFITNTEDITFWVLELATGNVLEKKTLFNDYIFLSNHSGIHLHQNTLAISSVKNQSIYIWNICKDGSITEIQTIGWNLHDNYINVSYTPSCKLHNTTKRQRTFTNTPSESSPNNLIHQELEPEAGTPLLSNLTQRILVFLWKKAQSKSRKAQNYFNLTFGYFSSIILYRVQFIDASTLLIKLGNREGIHKNSEPSSAHTSIFVIYNYKTTMVEAVYDNSSEELLNLYVCSNLFNGCISPSGSPYISHWGNNIYAFDNFNNQRIAVEKARNGGHAQAIKRTLSSLPLNCQSYIESPYFDHSIFSWDEKFINYFDRLRPCSEFPLKLYSRRTGQLKCKIDPHAIPYGSNPNVPPFRASKRYMSFLVHPTDPFIISIQYLNLQPQIINIHVHHSENKEKQRIEKVKERISIVNSSEFFILQHSGPTAFIITQHNQPSQANIPPIKVALGSTQHCSCHLFSTTKEICIHILWIMIKIFHVPMDDELLYQNNLTEHQILQLLDMRSSANKNTLLPLENVSVSSPSARVGITPRPVQITDICPICQDSLTAPSAPLTYCKLSCGNSIHVRCMKVLMDHQIGSLGLLNVKCPLCRNDFGSIQDLQLEFANSIKTDNQRKKLSLSKPRHPGFDCNQCNASPILGSFNLCDDCFLKGVHSQHCFQNRLYRTGKWTPSIRKTAPCIPTGFINDLQEREITEEDYETLLLLDSGPTNQSSIPLHVINTFPCIKILRDSMIKDLIKHGKCNVCALKVQIGQVVRKIPCGHCFHQDCIDRWLLQQRNTCPTCGLAAYSSIYPDDDTANEINLQGNYKAKSYQQTIKPKPKIQKPKRIDTLSEINESIQIIGCSSFTSNAENTPSFKKILIKSEKKVEIKSKNLSNNETHVSSFFSSPVGRRNLTLMKAVPSKEDANLDCLISINGLNIK